MEPGKYHGRLTDAVTSTAKTGNPQIVLSFEVSHRYNLDNGRAEPLNGVQKRTIYLSCHENALEYTVAKLTPMGWNEDFESPKFADAVYMEGVQLLCHIDGEDSQGRPRERWDLANWGGGKKAEPAPKDIIRTLNARYKALKGQSGKAKPAAAPPAPSQVRPPGTFDHVNDRNDAWAHVVNALKGKPQPVIEKEFLDAISEVVRKSEKEESQFTAAEWQKVAEEGEIPF